jgi:DNA polymerase III delta subunit
MSTASNSAYFWGEDAFNIDRAAREFERRLESDGQPMETWRTNPEDEPVGGAEATGSAAKRRHHTLDEIDQRLAMMPLFGGGTLVVVRQPGSLLAEATARERLLALARTVPEGNALCFTDLVASGAKGPAAKGVLRDAIADVGGAVAEFQVPGPGHMQRWLMTRAGELGFTLEPAAARLLAERVGGHVREADVDRRRRTELANGELEKLALYQPGGTVTTTHVGELVTESIPASTWAFLDAVGARAGAQAAGLADRLLADGAPLPVLVAQLHRRLRDLVLVREHIDTGSRPPEIVKAMKMQPFRAKKLSEQARVWSIDSLEAALGDLLAVDLRSKGISLDGSTLQMSDHIDALVFQTWLARHAASREGTRTG